MHLGSLEPRKTGHNRSLAYRLAYYGHPCPACGCIFWTGRLDTDGYGQINVDKQMRMAHRIAWIHERGPIPDGLYVLHKCDIRCCISTSHLWLGTFEDNMRDMVEKKRQARGERVASSRLTNAEVIAMRASTESKEVLALRHAIPVSYVSQILARERWNI